MTLLHDKINSYALNRGIEFNEPYTLTPTRTGTQALGTFTKAGSAAIVNEATGPAGGGGSWKFTQSTTTGVSNNFVGSATEVGALNDRDWSIGYWLKVDNLPTGTSGLTFGTNNPGGAGYTIGINGSNVGGGNASKLIFISGNTSTANYGYSPSTVVAGQWYYVAIRRSGNNAYFYVNGALVKEHSLATGTSNVSTLNFNVAAVQPNMTWNISNYYQAPFATIDGTAISEIWAIGSTAPATNALKYWDGATWATPISKSQWDGSSWVAFNGKIWNGSAWADIT